MTSPLASPQPWDLVASSYEQDVMPMFETFAREALRLAAPPAGSRVVDVACGPGTLAGLAAQQGLHVDALDFSSHMIERLVARRLPNVTAELGDGQALPYADRTFAAGFSLFGLMFFPGSREGLRRAATRAGAGGARGDLELDPARRGPADGDDVSCGLRLARHAADTPARSLSDSSLSR